MFESSNGILRNPRTSPWPPHVLLYSRISQNYILLVFFSTSTPSPNSWERAGGSRFLLLRKLKLNSMADKAYPPSSLFDLTGLEELAIFCIDPTNYLADLMDHSTPLQLKSLKVRKPLQGGDNPCSITVMEKLLKLSADSLENLSLDAAFGEQQNQGLDMFRRLPSFPALNSLVLWLSPALAPGPGAATLINAWPSAPNVTEITFRIQFWDDGAGSVEEEMETFHDIMEKRVVWKSVVKDLLMKFPRFQKLIFYFSAPELSEFHWEPSLRLILEDIVREKIPDAGDRLSFQ
ncbi:hypothetical protein B0H17DRAFT_323474 [Mycena rosella]|uniref:Uncharacterized protein n=1 Tax=Mycena rosella TaxID=1033263 RepID=A0AAD7DS90_MYCRO|nr:hypothetical protein B0H17DRAFT_323474 [Mycena rosella]